MVAYSFKGQFYAPIRIGLGLPIEPVRGIKVAAGVELRPKRQTIRAHRKRHARAGETLQLYYAQRHPTLCQKIGEARCVAAENIVIAFGKRPADTIISIEGEARYTGPALTKFARTDGFADWDEMRAFWEAEHGTEAPFSGVLIRWEPLQ